MHIDEKLNIVVPVRSDESGVRIHAYHTPISREVYEANFRTLAATKSALQAKGNAYILTMGPQTACLMLQDEGRKDSMQRLELDAKGNPLDGGVVALREEIKRLTGIMAPQPDGWKVIPVDIALSRGVIDSEEWSEVESALVFFTAWSATVKRAERNKTIQASASLLEGSSTSLSASDFLASLPKLTQEKPSDPQQAPGQFSIPS
jgi:hypothetical protein